MKLAAFLGGPVAQKIRATEGEVTPTIVSLLSDSDITAKYPEYLAWQKEADKAKARPKSPFYTQLSDVFQKELQNALMLNKTPEQAMKDAADAMKMIVE
jgi:multiple sugar transport system substrate-binding protein